MYTGRMVRVAVWGRDEKILCALVAGIVGLGIIYASMGWPCV